jgi:hypothetical protein
LSQITHKKSENYYFFAAVIFGVILLSAYSPVIFLDQSFLINYSISPEYLGVQNKSILFGHIFDLGTQAFLPDMKLASNMISEGEIPLWNPYVGIGHPLGADTTLHVFSPVNIGFLLPTEYWDLSLLIVLWIAGFSTFLFLRNLGLNFASSICGGVFYMLAGNFTWAMSHPAPFVMMATPLVLFSMDRVLKNQNPKNIILLSCSFGFSLLGGHLQSLFIQFVLIIFYFIYRNISVFFVSKTILENVTIKQNLISIGKSSSRVFLGLIGGISLVSFYVLFVFEYFQNGILENALQYDAVEYKAFSLAKGVMPYILGDVTRTWTTNTEWASPFGYSGAIALFFAVFSLYYIKKKGHVHRFTPIFFLLMSTLGLMRLANIPIISLIHTLPMFNIISFGSYSGGLIIFGFSVAAAFGINFISNEKISKKNVLSVISIATVTITILLIPVVNEFYFEQNLSEFIESSDIQKYIIFQVGQAFYFLIIAFVLSIILIKKRELVIILPVLVLLELSLYLPLGLHPISMAYKFILISTLMLILLVIVKIKQKNVVKDKKIFWTSVFLIIIAASIGSWAISEKSDYGMPVRYDSFEENEVTSFLQKNLEFQRMFSFENSMRPNLSVGYNIFSVGTFSSFNVNDYYTFGKKFLDSDQRPLGLGSNSWSIAYGPSKSLEKFFLNEKYFDFLGVKYILTQGYNFNTIIYGKSGQSGNFITLEKEKDNFYQTFRSPTEFIESIGIYLVQKSFEEKDEIILTVDSIPYSEENHRVSIISQPKHAVTNEFKIIPPIKDAYDKNFKFTLHYPQTTDEKYVVIYYDKKELYEIDEEIMYYSNDKKIEDIFMPFTITPIEKKYPIAFSFDDIYINENTDAFPRAYLVHDYVKVEPNTAQEFLEKNTDFDLRNSVILESDLKEFGLEKTVSTSNNVKIKELNENKIVIETFSEKDSILILTDVFYPGWEVFVDGEQTEIHRANGVVRAVVLEEGSHSVEFNYVPKSFWFGVIISIITLIILAGLYAYSQKYYKNNESKK